MPVVPVCSRSGFAARPPGERARPDGEGHDQEFLRRGDIRTERDRLQVEAERKDDDKHDEPDRPGEIIFFFF